MAAHRHRVARSYDRCYTGPVGPDQNPAAHGNICQIDECACGAVRYTNINQSHRETSGWVDPAEDGQ